jgi:hypothetical protein
VSRGRVRHGASRRSSSAMRVPRPVTRERRWVGLSGWELGADFARYAPPPRVFLRKSVEVPGRKWVAFSAMTEKCKRVRKSMKRKAGQGGTGCDLCPMFCEKSRRGMGVRFAA